MTELLDRGRRILAQQPFSMLVGSELVSFEPGKCELAVPIRPDLRQHHGFVHGGVIAYLADSSMTLAAGSLYDDALTLEIKINYLRPAVGEQLVARAECMHAGKRQAVSRCEIFGVHEGQMRLCAAGQGTISKLEPR